MTILIKNGTIVTMNNKREIIQGDLLIKEDRISQVGSLSNCEAEEVIDARDKLVIPGLVQSHLHLCQALFRGLADDLELMDWLKLRIWPLEAAHDEESLYYSALLGCAELLRGGTTSIIDMATVHHTDAVFEAVKSTGIRYLGGKCMMDHGSDVPAGLKDSTDSSLAESLSLLERWNNKEEGRIRYAFCPRFAVSCSDHLLREVQKMSELYQVPVHTHASENRAEVELVAKERGLPNILYLGSLGLCNEKLILAHCIHLDNTEMKLLADTQANIVHCPASNLKLASGLAKIPTLLDMGARASLGADGAPCNNNLSMFVEMRLAALIHKPFYGSTAMPAEKVFEMATLEGAKAMGLEGQIGSLEPGKKADVVIVSLDNWHNRPLGGASVYSHLVYQSQAGDVYATIVDGRVLMRNSELFSIDTEELRQKSEASLTRVQNRCGLR
ncbi:MAG: 5'-deoxyadenosine deaminase [Syntrophomonas sp.]